ncbi:hypothetical protein PRIPAC_79709 [Pristionchus pacificus]|uniref:Transmembrane ion channel n=1 Tax=Pristionchus pacificus TaxID=54126 RepID=A0A2A6CQA9_PRIPA|nr:hypothetical protein PRIPAC_79709 [Pristionchus pacificus]|eukprot:PDM80221.1 transmembrane ion channel [Pristionchus pacificus]
MRIGYATSWIIISMFALGPVERLAPTPVLPYSSSLFTAINFPPQASMNISVDFIATIDRSLEFGAMENFAMMITYAKLTDVNERSNEFSIVMGMMLHNNISHLYITIDQLWFPNFHPCEASSISFLSRDWDQVAKIFPNGDVRTIRQAEITYSCAFDTSNFPFDVQSCALCFTLNGYDVDDFTFNATLDNGALAQDMSEWRVHISSTTSSFNYCANKLCQNILHYTITLARNPQFWIGLVIIPIGFGLTTMMSMMVVVGILNDSLSKIEYIPCLGLFVLIQIAVTSVAVITVLLTDKLRRLLSSESRMKRHDSSRAWRFIQSITRNEHILRNFLFTVFALLHIGNLIWLLSSSASHILEDGKQLIYFRIMHRSLSFNHKNP